MSLKFGFFFIICFTSQINKILADHCGLRNTETVEVCLGNKNVEVQISPGGFTCEINKISRSKVRDDYTYTPGIAYHKFHTQAKTWNEARKVCFQEGGHLAVVNSKEEEKVLRSMFKTNYDNAVNTTSLGKAYVGVHALFEKGEWLTVLSEPLSSIGFDNWAAKCQDMRQQPTNSTGYQCAAMTRDCEGMSNEKCDERRPFFCEIPDKCSRLANAASAQATNRHLGVQISPDNFTYQTTEIPGPNSRDRRNAETVEVSPANKTLSVQISPSNSSYQATTEKPKPIIRADYTHTPGIGYYKFHTHAKTWNEARRICFEEGGHLAIINSREEEKVLQSILNKNRNNIVNAVSNITAYIGVHDLFGQGEWLTVLNKPVRSIGFDGWATKCGSLGQQPDNDYRDCHCGTIRSNCEGMLNYKCSDMRAFFCEIPEMHSQLGNAETAQAADKTHDVQISPSDFTCQALKRPKPIIRADYTHTPGIGYHKFHTQAKTWNEARRICFEEGGHLAIINSKEEGKVLRNMLEKNEDHVTNATHSFIAYLGVHALLEKGEWLTVLNEPLSSIGFDGWAANCRNLGQQPFKASTFQCGVIWTECEAMVAEKCNYSYPFFCEIPVKCL